MTGIPDDLVKKAVVEAMEIRGYAGSDGYFVVSAKVERIAEIATAAVLEAVGLPALLEDNEQLRVSVNRDFGEPLDEVYKTDGVFIVMQQIHDLRREKAALLERVEAAEAKVVDRPEGEPDDWQYGYHAGIRASRPDVDKVIAEYEKARDWRKAQRDALAAKVAGVEKALLQGGQTATIRCNDALRILRDGAPL